MTFKARCSLLLPPERKKEDEKAVLESRRGKDCLSKQIAAAAAAALTWNELRFFLSFSLSMQLSHGVCVEIKHLSALALTFSLSLSLSQWKRPSDP